jgi:hypothetical protein
MLKDEPTPQTTEPEKLSPCWVKSSDGQTHYNVCDSKNGLPSRLWRMTKMMAGEGKEWIEQKLKNK